MTMESKTAHAVIPLNENWQFKEAEDDTWLPVAQFPTNIHLDLLHHKKIPDPFWGQNESKVQWVGEKVWLYRTEFDAPATISENQKVVLSFEGLDTFATVVLNGIEILKSDNMFIPRRVAVTDKIRSGSKNTLEITFDSAWILGKKLQEQHPDHKWGCWNGDASRLVVRKAQYHYGWDWGPTLLTAGPWRPVYLEIYNSRIEDLYFTTEVADSLESAQVLAKADIEGTGSSVTFELSLDGQIVQTATAKVAGGHADATIYVEKPELWYPATYGKQPLYQLKAILHQDGAELDTVSKKVGIRKVVLTQRPLKDAPGKSFFFQINGIPVFCGGSNWIPADNFIPRITEEKYRSWLKLVRDGNQIMLRVWGGGIYEEDVFYDAADELGILVWQDFMFACGNYPATIPKFRESVKEEAIANVKRLRHHPSIVIWAGNNEDYQFQETEHLEYDPDNQDPDSWLKTDFPARYIYEKTLVDVTKELIPDTYYHFGSPYGGKDSTDPTLGDIHQWNVWHGTQERYQNYDKLAGRFVSEFGMEAFPDLKTIDTFIEPNSEERYAQSSTMDFHNKATGHEKRIGGYLAENFVFSTGSLADYVYITQLMQADCLSLAYRSWRRNWKGPGREYTAGALVWQINDCWPVTSWAIVDYNLRPKLAYTAVKQNLAPITIGIKREVHEHPRDKYTRAYIDIENRVYVWGSNFQLQNIDATLHIKAFDVVDGKKLYDHDHGRVTLGANRSTELVDFTLPMGEGDKKIDNPNRVVVAAYLLDSSDEKKQLARFISWPDLLKYVPLQEPKGLKTEFSEGSVSVSADVPVKGVSLTKDGVEFEDNLIDLVPEETVTLKTKGWSKKDGDQDDLEIAYYVPGHRLNCQ